MNVKKIYQTIVLLLVLAACNKKANTDPSPNLIDPKNTNAVMDALIMPRGTEQKTGTAPIPTNKSGTLSMELETAKSTGIVQNSPTSQTVETWQGEVIYINADVSCNNNNCLQARNQLARNSTPSCIYRVAGSSSYYTLPYSSSFGSGATLSFPFQLPNDIGNGQFTAEFAIVDEYGLVSNYTTTRVNIKRLADKDNPSKAFGCDFTKASDEVLKVFNDFSNNPNGATCAVLRTKVLAILNSLINCKEIDISTKSLYQTAINQWESINCSDLNEAKLVDLRKDIIRITK